MWVTCLEGENPSIWTDFTVNYFTVNLNTIKKNCKNYIPFISRLSSFFSLERNLQSNPSIFVARENGRFSFSNRISLINVASTQRRKYSIKVINSCNKTENDLSEFYAWFVGFSDGESNFQIGVRYSDITKTKVTGFSFEFRIGLHVDDLAVLQFIKDKLGIGNITIKSTGDICTFSVSNEEGIYALISIFDKYNLNTTKYLDYLDFRKAFILYKERDKNLYKLDKLKIIDQIMELKNRMNRQRTCLNNNIFSLHTNKTGINKNWLLGFIEAEGSFFVSRTDIEPSFSIELSSAQLFILESIKDFFINNLGFDKYSIYILKSSAFNIFSINQQKTKPSALLIVKNIRVLHNFFIPYFNAMKFNSKKGQDFLDWKLICEAVYKGSHKVEEIRALILRLSYTMNSYRLSSNLNKESMEPLTQEERNIIREALPTIVHLKDGRLLEAKSGKVSINRSLSVYEVITPQGEVLILDSFKDILNILGVGFRTLKRHINDDNTSGDTNEYKGYKIKRVPVFLNNK